MSISNYRSGQNRPGRVVAGLFLLTAGALLIAERLQLIDLPYWLFRWPMILIIVGLFVGLKEGFRGPSWLILIGIGAFFMLDMAFPAVNLGPFILPLVIIAFGLVLIFRRGHGRRFQQQMDETSTPQRFDKTVTEPVSNTTGPMNIPSDPISDDHWQMSQEDLIESTSIFAGVHKKILSKNFKGANRRILWEDRNLISSQADIHGTVVFEITAIFGGVKLIVPRNWMVKSENVAIFGGFDDKRSVHQLTADPGKTLIIQGTTIFGGIEVKNI